VALQLCMGQNRRVLSPPARIPQGELEELAALFDADFEEVLEPGPAENEAAPPEAEFEAELIEAGPGPPPGLPPPGRTSIEAEFEVELAAGPGPPPGMPPPGRTLPPHPPHEAASPEAEFEAELAAGPGPPPGLPPPGRTTHVPHPPGRTTRVLDPAMVQQRRLLEAAPAEAEAESPEAAPAEVEAESLEAGPTDPTHTPPTHKSF
jgi:hypothetical protein